MDSCFYILDSHQKNQTESDVKHTNDLSPNTKWFRSFSFMIIGFAMGVIVTTYTNLPQLAQQVQVGVHEPLIKTTSGVTPPMMFSQNKLNFKVPQNQSLSLPNVTRKPWRLFPLISDNPKDYWKPVTPENVGIAVLEDRKRYVCPGFGDRLGNLMFLYASNYGLAVDLNITLAMSTRDPIYTPFDKVPRPPTERFKLCKHRTQSYNQRFGRIYVNFPVMPKGPNVRFGGYLQCWKYFSHSFDDIRQQFSWKMHIREKASEIISNLVKLRYRNNTVNVTTVSMHIRRGDYVSEKRPMADKIYIESAKEYFMTRYKRVLFIVAANPDKEAQDWCKRNIINGSGVSVMSGKNDRYIDMAILTLTDHIIISTGTYGWWGGFLNKGTVVHYDWIPPGYYKFRREDYILPWWVGINSTTKYPRGPPTPRPKPKPIEYVVTTKHPITTNTTKSPSQLKTTHNITSP